MGQPEYLAGMLRVLILSELARAPGYGYGIAKALVQRSGGELTVKPESLYPVLHRMEGAGLVSVRWELNQGRPRKIYALTPKGRRSWQRARKQFVRLSAGALKAIGADAAAETP